jgi:hypothetical protein
MTDTIINAVQYQDHVLLTLQPEEGEPYEYVLRADDPHGDAPELRAELARMVEAGEIVVMDKSTKLSKLEADNGV